MRRRLFGNMKLYFVVYIGTKQLGGRPSYLMLSKPVQDRPTLRQHPAKQGQLISANIHSVTVILLCKQNMLHVNVHLTLAC